jgi:hypothetical protein
VAMHGPILFGPCLERCKLLILRGFQAIRALRTFLKFLRTV